MSSNTDVGKSGLGSSFLWPMLPSVCHLIGKGKTIIRRGGGLRSFEGLGRGMWGRTTQLAVGLIGVVYAVFAGLTIAIRGGLAFGLAGGATGVLARGV